MSCTINFIKYILVLTDQSIIVALISLFPYLTIWIHSHNTCHYLFTSLLCVLCNINWQYNDQSNSYKLSIFTVSKNKSTARNKSTALFTNKITSLENTVHHRHTKLFGFVKLLFYVVKTLDTMNFRSIIRYCNKMGLVESRQRFSQSVILLTTDKNGIRSTLHKSYDNPGNELISAIWAKLAH